MKLRNVVLVDGARSAFGRGGVGKLTATRMDTAGAKVLRALLDRNPKINDWMIEDIGIGNVTGTMEITFLCAVQRLAGLPMEVSGFVSNRQCGSSMETFHRIATAIMVGSIDCGVSMGIERMGRGLGAGMGNMQSKRNGGFNMELMRKNDKQRNMSPDYNNYFSVPIPDSILDMPPLMAMTQTAQNVAEMYQLSRVELDAFAAKSHHKAQAAYAKGNYKQEIIPLEVEDPVIVDKKWVDGETGKMITFDRDECIRGDTTAEKLAGLGPISGIMSPGNKEIIITAGNSCPTNDGISCAILMSEEKAIALGLEPLARIIGIGVAGVKPQIMGMGPVPSTKKALAHAGLNAKQIDRVEFNEAFAAQVLPSIREMGIDEAKVNVNGGSIAIGHPLGATGTRMITTVAMELRRSKLKYGLATQCIGAGMGISTIIEALN